MKKLLFQAIVCCATLLPLAQANAKTYGGWLPGKTFTFTVTERVTAKTVGAKVTKNVAVPAGIPNFKKGAKVKFTIGAKGQLTATGMSLPFKEDATTANVYATLPTAANPRANVGQVYKNGKKPTGVSLSFIKVTLSNFIPTTTTVVYVLE
ncbi:MAG: hypothetical protein ABI162_01100 [Luteolibacter sp.]